nr:uncharacterized protein LOC113802815 [Penaeus vannamei]
MTTAEALKHELEVVAGLREEGTEDDDEDPTEGTPGRKDPPIVVVEDVEGTPWHAPPLVSVTNWGTPSGPSSGTCSPHSRSPSLGSLWSEASLSDDAGSISYSPKIPKGPRQRARHASSSFTQDTGKQNPEVTRLCSSQELLATEIIPPKHKHSLKTMFLDVFHPESSRRTRSASSGEVRRRSPSTGDSKMRKLISKFRSRSQSDLLDVKSRRSFEGSINVGSHVSLNPGESAAGEEGEGVPPTAINTRLVGRFRKHSNANKRRWSVFEQHILKSRGQRHDHAHDGSSNPATSDSEGEGQEGCVISLDDPSGESTTEYSKASTKIQLEGGVPPDPVRHAKQRLGRTRSNSDSRINVLEKKQRRRRGSGLAFAKEYKVIDRLIDFHKRNKHRGSLPSLAIEVQRQKHLQKLQDLPDGQSQKKTQGPKASNGSIPNGSITDPLASRAQSFHNLTDFAVEDYFSSDNERHLSGDDADAPGGAGPRNLSPYYGEEGNRARRHRFSIDHIWNVFRGRRLSHDVGAAGRHVTETVVPWLRGKSRSVDHTIHNPFDLDVLRRKIGDRTSSEPSRDIPSPSPEPVDGSKENLSGSEKKMGGRGQPAPPCKTYTVSANDTLTSIAARFDTTPSELTKINRISTRFLFPGQVLAVPDKSAAQEDDAGGGERGQDLLEHEDTNGQDLLAHIRPVTPTQRGDLKTPVSPHNYPRTPANSVDVEKSLDRECLEKFLKISVRHITDGQGVVAGVLLVTPNAIMFDPNVSDPLVIEHGPESYGVIAPMDFVVNAALYYDIAHMRVKDTNLPKPEIPKPEIYWGPGHVERVGSQESPGKDASLCKDATFPELAASQDDNDSSCSCGGDTRETSAFPKAFEHELLTPIGSDVSPASGEGQNSSGQPSPSGILQQQSQLQPQQQAQQQPQQPVAPVAGDLTPIAEASRLEDSQATSPNLAQTECDNMAAQIIAQTELISTAQTDEESTCNEKKRTTSVTFDLGEGEETTPDLVGEANMQESRKQKVLKRLSYPLSWMESFSTDKENMPQHQSYQPQSAPPVSSTANSSTDSLDGNKAGMFSNVFNMSNVSNMLSRRPSLDFARRPGSQQPLSVSVQQTQSAAPPIPQAALASNVPTHVQQEQQMGTQVANPQSQKRAQYKEGPKYGLKSMVSMDDMPELFASFDKLIPKPATSCEDPPLYLCLRMGKPSNKRIPKSTPIMSYGKKRMRPEYWFSIPRNRLELGNHVWTLEAL